MVGANANADPRVGTRRESSYRTMTFLVQELSVYDPSQTMIQAKL